MAASTATRAFNLEQLRQRFKSIRDTTVALTAGLSEEDQMLQSMPDASPVKWHLAHTTWFFETFILEKFASSYRPFDPRFKYLFNSYYKQLGSHPFRGNRGLVSRPSLQEVRDYRQHVDAEMLRALDAQEFSVAGQEAEEALVLLELGLNHEQQHQELILTDIKHALWSSPLRPEFDKSASSSSPAANAPLQWTEVEGGVYSIGHESAGFSFDNECPAHNVYVQPFQLASRLVTNGEYLAFIADNGYRRPELWLSDGWDTVGTQGWRAPLYWEQREDGSWWNFRVGLMRPVALSEDEPVCHISYFEADAYARWAGGRLPTEQEWEIAAAFNTRPGTFQENAIHDGVVFNEGALHPLSALGQGLQQMLGDVWEWTSSSYAPYPGYRPAAGAVGEYNSKFMCNQYVLRGGSCATPVSHIRNTYRNFFPAHVRWQFSGVRLAR